MLIPQGLAFAAVPVGWERDRRRRSAGLTTYALLSASVCGFLLLALRNSGRPIGADAFYGVLFGVGFVGSGAIVKSPEHDHGLNTAIGLWITGAIGAGVAYGSALVSTAVSLMTVATLWAPALARRREATS